MQRSALCRSRRELSNAYFVAKFGLDTAKNEPCQVCPTEPFPAAAPACAGGASGLTRSCPASCVMPPSLHDVPDRRKYVNIPTLLLRIPVTGFLRFGPYYRKRFVYTSRYLTLLAISWSVYEVRISNLMKTFAFVFFARIGRMTHENMNKCCFGRIGQYMR